MLNLHVGASRVILIVYDHTLQVLQVSTSCGLISVVPEGFCL